jgi:hypothetical protein
MEVNWVFVTCMRSLLQRGVRARYSCAKAKLSCSGGHNHAIGPTQIKLSRTVPLNEEQKLVPELNAKIWIESDAAATKIAVNATGAGLYTSNVFPLNTARNYRIRINTADGRNTFQSFCR